MSSSEKIANLISYLLSPNVFAIYIILTLLFYPPLDNKTNVYLTLLLSIVFLCIFPIIAILYSQQKGTIDIWVSNQKDRTFFYIIALTGYVIASIIFLVINQKTLYVLSIAYFFVTLVVTLSNFSTKVSSHTAGVAGPLTAMTLIYGLFLLPIFLLIPLVFWSRLKLKAHTITQLTLGSLIGAVVTFIVFYLLFPFHFTPLI
jgi:membrane-associated phospholipid phosphatase